MKLTLPQALKRIETLEKALKQAVAEWDRENDYSRNNTLTLCQEALNEKTA